MGVTDQDPYGSIAGIAPPVGGGSAPPSADPYGDVARANVGRVSTPVAQPYSQTGPFTNADYSESLPGISTFLGGTPTMTVHPERAKQLVQQANVALSRGVPKEDVQRVLSGSLANKNLSYDPFRVLAPPAGIAVHFDHDQDLARMNPGLMQDISHISQELGFRLDVGTAITGHSATTTSGNPSRHTKGNAVDVSMINGVSYKSDPKLFTQLAQQLQDALVSHGYVKNSESGNQTAVLFGFNDPARGGNHLNHVHISNNGGPTIQQQYDPTMAEKPDARGSGPPLAVRIALGKKLGDAQPEQPSRLLPMLAAQGEDVSGHDTVKGTMAQLDAMYLADPRFATHYRNQRANIQQTLMQMGTSRDQFGDPWGFGILTGVNAAAKFGLPNLMSEAQYHGAPLGPDSGFRQKQQESGYLPKDIDSSLWGQISSTTNDAAHAATQFTLPGLLEKMGGDPGSILKAVSDTGGTLHDAAAGLVDPMAYANLAAELGHDPLKVVEQTVNSINNIWGKDLDDKKVTLQDRVKGVITLVQTGLLATDFALRVRGSFEMGRGAYQLSKATDLPLPMAYRMLTAMDGVSAGQMPLDAATVGRIADAYNAWRGVTPPSTSTNIPTGGGGSPSAPGAAPLEALALGPRPPEWGGAPVEPKGPNAPEGGAPPEIVPETDSTVLAQIEAMKQGLRPAVLVVKGGAVPDIGADFLKVPTQVGTFLAPKGGTLTPATIRDAVKNGTYHELLGHVEAKGPETTTLVVARDPKTGAEIQSSAVSDASVDAQVEKFRQMYPGAKIEVGGEDLAQKVIDDRQSGAPTSVSPEPAGDSGRYAVAPGLKPTAIPRGTDYYIVAGADGKNSFQLVPDAKRAVVPGFEKYDLFVHHPIGEGKSGWTISEGKTGMSVIEKPMPSQKAAIAQAAKRMGQVGARVDTAIENALSKTGPSPRWRAAATPEPTSITAAPTTETGVEPRILTEPVTPTGSGRDVVVVRLPSGKNQAFYRSTGHNSRMPGRWLPMGGIVEGGHLNGWFNKMGFAEGDLADPSEPLHRLGTEENRNVSDWLGKQSIPRGTQTSFSETHALLAKHEALHSSTANYNEAISKEAPRRIGNWDRYEGTFSNVTRKGKYDARHPDQNAAKAGDVQAAARVVAEVINPDTVEAIRKQLAGRTPVVVAVHAIDGTSVNVLPLAYAAELGRRLDLPVDTDIVQSNTAGRTGTDAAYRLEHPATFSGKVKAGQDYLLVDDFTTMGGTLADLRSYIEARGGHVILSTTLFQSRNMELPPTKAQLDTLHSKYPDLKEVFQNALGFAPEGLTRAEASHYIKHPEAVDLLRSREAPAAQGGRAPAVPGAPAGQAPPVEPKPGGVKAPEHQWVIRQTPEGSYEILDHQGSVVGKPHATQSEATDALRDLDPLYSVRFEKASTSTSVETGDTRSITDTSAEAGQEAPASPEESPDPLIRQSHTPEKRDPNDPLVREFRQGKRDRNGFYPKMKEFIGEKATEAYQRFIDSDQAPASPVVIDVPGDGEFTLEATYLPEFHKAVTGQPMKVSGLDDTGKTYLLSDHADRFAIWKLKEAEAPQEPSKTWGKESNKFITAEYEGRPVASNTHMMLLDEPALVDEIKAVKPDDPYAQAVETTPDKIQKLFDATKGADLQLTPKFLDADDKAILYLEDAQGAMHRVKTRYADMAYKRGYEILAGHTPPTPQEGHALRLVDGAGETKGFLMEMTMPPQMPEQTTAYRKPKPPKAKLEGAGDDVAAAKKRLRARFASIVGERSVPYEMRPDGTPQVQRLGQEAIRDVRRQGSLLASAIARDLTSNNQVVLVGQKVETPADLATLAQVYRDPRFETFRYFFTNDGEVVGQSGFSCRLPSSGPIHTSTDSNEILAWIKDQIARTGADGVWALHNHPSGNPMPSLQDHALTARLQKWLPGLFKGHVIIDSNKFAWINPSGEWNIDPLKGLGPDTLLEPSVSHPLLGKPISDPQDLADIGDYLKTNKNFVTLVGRGAQGDVRGIREVPIAVFEQAEKYPNRAAAIIRRFARQVGSPDIGMILPEERTWDALASGELIQKALTTGLLMDVVTPGGRSIPRMANMERGTADHMSLGKLLTDQATKVQEPSAPYGDDQTLADLRTLAEAYGSGSFEDFVHEVRSDIGPVPEHLLRQAWEGADPYSRIAGLGDSSGSPDLTGDAGLPPKIEMPGEMETSFIPGGRQFFERDLKPGAIKIAKTAAAIAREAGRILSPVQGEAGEKMEGILRDNLAQLAFGHDRLVQQFANVRNQFQKASETAKLQYIDDWENGRAQPNPTLQAVQDAIQKAYDQRIAEVRSFGPGHLTSLIENYFPHIWADSEAAQRVYAEILGKRPLEGSKGFLKQRKIPTVKEGMDRGLQLVTTNPVDLNLLKLHEMDRYITAQRILREMKRSKLAEFVSVLEKPPMGWVKIDDRIAMVYGGTTFELQESHDKLVYQRLQKLIQDLQFKHTRKYNIGGRRLGYAEMGGSGRMYTKSAGAEQIITHELGHLLDDRYGLWEWLTRKGAGVRVAGVKGARKLIVHELRDLADLRDEGLDGKPGEVSASRKSYVRNRYEKMANVIDAYVHAPEKMGQVAPTVKARLEQLIDQHPELQPLRDIKPSLVRGVRAEDVPLGGLIVKGQFYAPFEAARLLNNHLAPGLRNSKTYQLLNGLNNNLNAFQLGFSAFHATFSAFTDSVSEMAAGLEKLTVPGMRMQGAWGIGKSVIPLYSPVESILKGSRLRKAVLAGPTSVTTQTASGTLTVDTDLARYVDALQQAGGRLRMDRMYDTGAMGKMLDEFRAGNLPGTLLRLPFGVLDAVITPLMKVAIPRLKLGAFMRMAEIELEKLGPDASLAQQRAALASCWDSVDNRYGQMVYDNLFWNKTLKDASHLAVRSVGWNLGDVREIGGALVDTTMIPHRALFNRRLGRLPIRLQKGVRRKPIVTKKMYFTAALPILTAIMGAAIMYLFTGKRPKTLRDYFEPQIDEKGNRVQLPTYMKDVIGLARKGPSKYTQDKLSPLAQTLIELNNNQSYMEQQIRNPEDSFWQQLEETGKYLLQQGTPLSVRNQMQGAQHGESRGKQALSFFGFTPVQTSTKPLPQRLKSEGLRKLAEAARAARR